MENIMIEKQRRIVMNKRKCPICGTSLEQDVKQGEVDEYIVYCSRCGEYALSCELYEDFINWPKPRVNLPRIAAYLSCYKRTTSMPCICEYEGAESEEYDLISIREITDGQKERRSIFFVFCVTE